MTDPITHFREHGYCAVPLFDPALVAAAQADIAEHIDRVSHALYLPFEKSCPDSPLTQRLDRIWQHDRGQADLLRKAICTDAHRGPHLQAIADTPQLRATAEQLGGHPLGDRVVRMRASIAAFPEHLHDWHSDVAIDDGSACGRVWITAWIPLSDAGPGEGGLEVVAGKRNAPLPHCQDNGFAIPESELAGMPRAQPECPAGHVLFLDRFTPHRSLPPSGNARFALTIWMKAA
jgi:hypothetical protein